MRVKEIRCDIRSLLQKYVIDFQRKPLFVAKPFDLSQIRRALCENRTVSATRESVATARDASRKAKCDTFRVRDGNGRLFGCGNLTQVNIVADEKASHE
jgi:hypothetical protein